MWWSLTPTRRAELTVEMRQVLGPKDAPRQARIVTARALLTEEVSLATPKVVRLSYEVREAAGELVLGAVDPMPWPHLERLHGERFELMLTAKGATLAPRPEPKAASEPLPWLAQLAEEVRAAWLTPPHALVAGQTWVQSAGVALRCTALRVDADEAEINAEGELTATPPSSRPDGTLALRLVAHRTRGLLRALRTSTVTLARQRGDVHEVHAVAKLVRTA